jgi:hypothetical protein
MSEHFGEPQGKTFVVTTIGFCDVFLYCKGVLCYTIDESKNIGSTPVREERASNQYTWTAHSSSCNISASVILRNKGRQHFARLIRTGMAIPQRSMQVKLEIFRS